MCISLWGFDDHPVYAFVLASNRDELHARPTLAAHYWEDSPSILGGRDGERGGTWLGITTGGRVAVLTNVREDKSNPAAQTRGDLTTGFLQGNESPMQYLERVAEEDPGQRNGFNLIVADLKTKEMAYYSNRSTEVCARPQRVAPGVHGLSNASVDTPWPKVERGKQLLQTILRRNCSDDELLADEVMKEILRDRVRADDSELPATGFDPALEREFSPIFVECDTPAGMYGTRSSTIIAVRRTGQVFFRETYLEDSQWKDHQFVFQI